jgi:membrane associated rhomboid family serine protease
VRWRSFRSVIVAVVLVNVTIFIHEMGFNANERARFALRYGAIPATMCNAWKIFREFGPHRGLLGFALPLLTANYLHTDAEHLIGNMIFFWVFANVLGEVVGPWLLLVTYVVGGAFAVVVYAHTNPASEVPMVGASGAVAALEGAYLTLLLRWRPPWPRVWPLKWEIHPIGIAIIAVGNMGMDAGAFFQRMVTGVAYGAHLGGFLGGALVAMILSAVRGRAAHAEAAL